MGDFNKCLARVLKWEGGNDDDSDDPGGRTSRGITQSEYDRFRSAIGKQRRDVWSASDDEISLIYYQNYWMRIRGNDLDNGVALMLFDSAVLNGVSQTAKWVQRALGPLYAGSVDGDFGPRTFDGLRRVGDNDRFIADIADRRIEMMRGLRHAWKYIRGWTARVNDMKAVGQAWATGSVGPEPSPLAGEVLTPRGRSDELRTPPCRPRRVTQSPLSAASEPRWPAGMRSLATSGRPRTMPPSTSSRSRSCRRGSWRSARPCR
ncbi:MAG: glycoside hydrolase family 108 protein [Methylacidiphilales bacterium]|nr:glycoside hydrolase family 108 protein [Candidatus Methylacidiphilales bacterium]